ncbi:MAG: C4-dicarboxylate ABC transporter [Hyphomicrobiales bacterium]|nr:MAG: C4-dicarboxylate ABC transporter [Hyphomicrobiales bacterium]
MDYLPFAVFFVLLILNIPVAIALASGALSFFFIQSGLPLPIYAQRLSSSAASFPLLAIPMFTLIGVIMNHAGITKRLLDLAEVLVGHFVGALAQSNIVLATLMGGLSASGYAEAAMQSKMLGNEMIRRGYPAPFAAAIVASSSIITPIIPPGLGFIIYGFLANVSIGRLFLAGIVPGLMLAGSMMVVAYILSKQRGYAKMRETRATAPEIWTALRGAGWALTIPIFVIVGIRYGVFTPTEAGAVMVVYSVLIGLFAHKEISIRDLPKILTEASLSAGMVMVVITAATAFGYYMTLEHIPGRIAEYLTLVTSNPLLMLLLLNLFLLVLGMFLESIAGLIILTPILVPVVSQLGIDPVHFGLIFVLNLSMGALTPPVGGLMYITCSLLNVKIVDFVKAVWPLFLTQLLVLLILTVFPVLVTFLPNLLMGPGH